MTLLQGDIIALVHNEGGSVGRGGENIVKGQTVRESVGVKLDWIIDPTLNWFEANVIDLLNVVPM